MKNPNPDTSVGTIIEKCEVANFAQHITVKMLPATA